jgi:hypothetical protein
MVVLSELRPRRRVPRMPKSAKLRDPLAVPAEEQWDTNVLGMPGLLLRMDGRHSSD